MNVNLILGLVFIVSGLFSLIASIKNWNFFFGSRKTRFIQRLVGRIGARIFYGLLGIVIIVVGILAILGNINLAADF